MTVFANEINGVVTDFYFNDFENTLFFIITQFEKPGTFVKVSKTPEYLAGGRVDSTYEVSVLFGSESDEILASALFIATELKIPKNCVISIALKDYSPSVIKGIVDILSKRVNW